MHKFEHSSIKQFDWWARHQSLSYNWFFNINKYIVSYIKPEGRLSILDVGCGWGLLLKQLVKMDNNLGLYGIDISPEMVRVAKKECKNYDMRIVQGSADKLPYRNNQFEIVTCILSFHHHPDSLQSLKEMYRVLKPRGRIILLDQFNNGLIRKTMIFFIGFFFQEKDVHIYSKDERSQLFEKVGFKNISQKEQNFYRLLTIAQKL